MTQQYGGVVTSAPEQQGRPALDPWTRALWLGLRDALIVALRAVELYLDMPRSRETRAERKGYTVRHGEEI